MKQLDLFKPALPKWVEKMLGTMVRWANAGDDWCYYHDNKHQWYRIKNKLLERYGIFQGEEIQRISHLCRACEGTGKHWYDNGSELCWRCSGSGVWQYEFNFLQRYELFGISLHRPYKPRVYTFNRHLYTPTLKGKIKHDEHHPRKSWWSFIILAAFFSPSELIILFRYWSYEKRFILGQQIGWWLQTIIFSEMRRRSRA